MNKYRIVNPDMQQDNVVIEGNFMKVENGSIQILKNGPLSAYIIASVPLTFFVYDITTNVGQ